MSAYSEAKLRDERVWLRARLRDLLIDVQRFEAHAADAALGGASMHLHHAAELVVQATAVLDRVLDPKPDAGLDRSGSDGST